MWELNHKESWAPKNWCFWTMVLEKTLDSPLDCKEIQPVHPKGDQSWIFFGRTDAEVEVSILWPLDAKRWKRPWCWERLRAQEKGTQRMSWLDGIINSMDMSMSKVREIMKDRNLACCNPWGHEELNMTEQLKDRIKISIFFTELGQLILTFI